VDTRIDFSGVTDSHLPWSQSNDSDLLEPVRMVRQQLGLPVGIINPQQRTGDGDIISPRL
jgi:hypothetical protein